MAMPTPGRSSILSPQTPAEHILQPFVLRLLVVAGLEMPPVSASSGNQLLTRGTFHCSHAPLIHCRLLLVPRTAFGCSTFWCISYQREFLEIARPAARAVSALLATMAEPICYINGKRHVLPQGRGETTLLQFLRGALAEAPGVGGTSHKNTIKPDQGAQLCVNSIEVFCDLVAGAPIASTPEKGEARVRTVRPRARIPRAVLPTLSATCRPQRVD